MKQFCCISVNPMSIGNVALGQGRPMSGISLCGVMAAAAVLWCKLAAALPLCCRVTEKGNYSEKDASELIRQVLEGVAYLHSRGKHLTLYIESLQTL